MSISFGTVANAAEEVSASAAALGERFYRAVPQPCVENGGLLQAALFWAAHVGAIFPLRRGDDPEGRSKQSHPWLGEGDEYERGTRDLAVISDWWRQDPMANIGIVTKANGILIVDFDPKVPGVADKWRALRERYRLDVTGVPRSVSPSGDGGYHLWYRLPPGADYNHSPIMPGLDRPWQVPVPPSLRLVTVDAAAKDPERREAFRPYVWRVGDPRALPVAPPILLGEPVETTPTRTGGGDANDQAGPLLPPGSGDLSTVPAVPVGQQSYIFKRLACSMVRKGRTDAEIVSELLELAERSPRGREHEPWTASDMHDFAYHARRFIERQDREAAATHAAAIAGIKRSLLS
jgi:hypothetical protein